MPDNILLYLVFLSQIFLISLIIPRKLTTQLKEVLSNHPESEFPKLYPVSKDSIDIAMNTFMNLNLIIMMIGLVVVAHGFFYSSEEMLNWDSQSVVNMYFMLQMIPLIYAEVSGSNYFKIMRKVNRESIRKAELQPRRLFNYVSPALLSLSVITLIGFILVIIYISQDPFDGFAGYWNILGVMLVNCVFAGVIIKNLYGKKVDPYLSAEDRFNQTERIIKLMLFASIAANVFLSATMFLSNMNLRHLIDVFASIYFQILIFISFSRYQPNDIDYDVYKITKQNIHNSTF